MPRPANDPHFLLCFFIYQGSKNEQFSRSRNNRDVRGDWQRPWCWWQQSPSGRCRTTAPYNHESKVTITLLFKKNIGCVLCVKKVTIFLSTDSCFLGTLYLKTLMCHQRAAALPYCPCGCDATCLIQLAQLGLVLKMSVWEIEKCLVPSCIL